MTLLRWAATDFVEALGAVKLASARPNHEPGLLDGRRFAACAAVAEEVRAAALDDQFVVDVIRGGTGTSTSMDSGVLRQKLVGQVVAA
ncbi:hypothetical protein [Dactylosporangium sp. CA-233914]|uniref:hypothetical protein n=1 Tax=Dactylosporangium sp. CA-233914 TaxID=3239934 RepID=UPI003D8DE44B